MPMGGLDARSAAAEGMMGGGAGLDAGMPDPGMMAPEDGGGMPPPPGGDLEGALAGVEAALEGMPPEQAEEIRGHLNAIRDVAAKDTGPAMAAEDTPPPPPGGDEIPEEPKISVP